MIGTEANRRRQAADKPSLNRHSAHPYHGGGDVGEGEKASIEAVEAG
jgi:hypothetical protein